MEDESSGTFCNIPTEADYSGVTRVSLKPDAEVSDYIAAMQLANLEADKRLDEQMLLAWYDRERNFESPQHASECHLDSAEPGDVDYAIYHGARLKIDMDNNRFIFFYMPMDF